MDFELENQLINMNPFTSIFSNWQYCCYQLIRIHLFLVLHAQPWHLYQIKSHWMHFLLLQLTLSATGNSQADNVPLLLEPVTFVRVQSLITCFLFLVVKFWLEPTETVCYGNNISVVQACCFSMLLAHYLLLYTTVQFSWKTNLPMHSTLFAVSEYIRWFSPPMYYVVAKGHFQTDSHNYAVTNGVHVLGQAGSS